MQLEHEWLDLIKRMLAGSASSTDSDTLQAGVIDGRVLLSGTNHAVDAGTDISQSIVMVGTGNQLHVRLGDEHIEALRSRLFPKSRGLPPPFPSLLFVGREKD